MGELQPRDLVARPRPVKAGPGRSGPPAATSGPGWGPGRGPSPPRPTFQQTPDDRVQVELLAVGHGGAAAPTQQLRARSCLPPSRSLLPAWISFRPPQPASGPPPRLLDRPPSRSRLLAPLLEWKRSGCGGLGAGTAGDGRGWLKDMWWAGLFRAGFEGAGSEAGSALKQLPSPAPKIWGRKHWKVVFLFQRLTTTSPRFRDSQRLDSWVSVAPQTVDQSLGYLPLNSVYFGPHCLLNFFFCSVNFLKYKF